MADPIRVLRLFGVPDDNRVEVIGSEEGSLSFKAEGNTGLPSGFRDERLRTETVYLGRFRERRLPGLGENPGVVVNGICTMDAQSAAMAQARELCRRAVDRGAAIANPPRRVELSARESLPDLLAGVADLTVPRATRLKAPSVNDLRDRLEAATLSFPFTIAPVAPHPGVRLVRIENREALWKLSVLPLDGRDFRVIPYTDLRSEDGLYRRFRMIRIGERLLPGHLLIGDRWDLHRAPRRSMLERPRLQAEEQSFLADPFGFLGRDRIALVQKVFDRVGLDFAAFDFAPTPGGGLFLVACGACFNVSGHHPRLAYLAPYTAALEAAMESLILDKAQER